VESLREDFPGKSYTWIRRALLRLGDVEETRGNLYIVQGRRELGNWRSLYQVWFSEREGRWLCTCYASAFCFRRRREICTHVAAVILYRRHRKALQKLENKRVYVAKAEVECRGRVETNGELCLRSLRGLKAAWWSLPSSQRRGAACLSCLRLVA